MRLYFETSAVNYLANVVFSNPSFGSLSTKKFQNQKGNKWQISNITLWEIFLTKNAERRYHLFDLARCLFYDKLISSPEEIIINYIKSGCPKYEKKYELESRGTFSNEWTKACKNLDYIFQPDREQLNQLTDHFRFFGEYFGKSFKGFYLMPVAHTDEVTQKIGEAFLEASYDKLLKIAGNTTDETLKRYIKYSMQVVMLILCYGIGVDHSAIESFWNQERDIEPLERLKESIKKYPKIFFRGPIASITKMILLQSKNNGSRGLYFDSLQSIYITYSDLFITDDKHFLRFRDDNRNDPNMSKIISIRDINFFNP